MARIIMAGFHHETNTFSPVKADFNDFEQADDWPGLAVGDAVFTAVSNVRIPICGAIDELMNNHEIVPLLWCSATPSAHVTQEAYEKICAMIIKRIEKAGTFDGVYLDLHGAMVCEHLDDGEGELIRRIRKLVGADIPIAVSLDLHANITELMFSNASVIDCYRTYPHIDMQETGRRTAMHLEHLIENHTANYPFKAMRRISFLIPHNWGSTLSDPCQTIYRQVKQIADGSSLVVTFASGFPLADIAEAGPVILAYGEDEKSVNQAADGLLALIEVVKPQFKGEIYTLREAIVIAQDHIDHGTMPVVIADTQDNPGGGGPGDTVGLLRALVETERRGAVVAMIYDPEVAQLAHDAGLGQVFTTALGEQSLMAGHQPLQGEYTVLALGDGNFAATGPMYGGAQMKLGLMARLEIQGVQVLVTSKSVQVADQSIFRHLGVEPADQEIISVKSSVHFRNDFQEIAGAILLVAAPGPVAADLKLLDYQKVPQSMIL